MYSTHSRGRSFRFFVLQSLHAGTTLPLVLLPPRDRGTTWSMVNSEGFTGFRQ